MQMVNFGYLRDLTPPADNVKIWLFINLLKFLSISGNNNRNPIKVRQC